MTEVEQPPQNGIDLSAAEDDDNNKARPADIEQDMREMERRKRVEAIMSSKLFREELERIVDSARDGGSASGILQQLSDIVGMPASRVGSVFKTSNCMMPINDIRGVESMGYAKGEKILRCKLAATFRLLDLYGWNQGLGAQITARLKVDQEYFLVNPYGILYHEITASSLNKVDMQGHIVEQGTTNFGVNRSHFILHSVLHAARPDIRCAIYIGCSPVVAVSSLKTGLLPITKDACVLGEITTHPYTGTLLDTEERDKLVRNLGPNSKVLILANYGALCCGETIEEAFFAACHIVQACETQLKLLPVGLDNLVLIPEESRKIIYEQSRRPPEDLEKRFAALAATGTTTAAEAVGEQEEAPATTTTTVKIGSAPKWRVGGAEFEALMRMLDNAGYRTGYIYRHPLIKSDPPKPKNDVELPPAVSSLGYLLEEEELYKQGIWKKGDLRKGGDRSRWLNSPNVYQKVEVLETGTPDPKKITKWVAEGSPTHSTAVRIEDPLQFVPAGTNPKEFKRLQQQIKDNRRADKISAGPQSHILEGVTWDEANRIKDATVSSAGDHVVLMGAASKGIIQRGFQHNATVYKAPYAKNPFDNVTDDELNEYKRTVERKKKSIHGEYTDTDFSESEALSSLQTSGAQHTKQTTTTTAAVSQSEPEDISEHQVMRIETQQAPVPSQPEVVLSDATLSFINGERSHTATNRKPPTGRDTEELLNVECEKNQDPMQLTKQQQDQDQSNKENIHAGNQNIKRNAALMLELRNDLFFQRQKSKYRTSTSTSTTSSTQTINEITETNNENTQTNNENIKTNNENTQTINECIETYNENTQTNNERIQINNENTQTYNERFQINNENTQTYNERFQINNENTQTYNERFQVNNENTQTYNERFQINNENTQTNNENIRIYNENTQIYNANTQTNNENTQTYNENTQTYNDNPQIIYENTQINNRNSQTTNNVTYNNNTKKEKGGGVGTGANPCCCGGGSGTKPNFLPSSPQHNFHLHESQTRACNNNYNNIHNQFAIPIINRSYPALPAFESTFSQIITRSPQPHPHVNNAPDYYNYYYEPYVHSYFDPVYDIANANDYSLMIGSGGLRVEGGGGGGKGGNVTPADDSDDSDNLYKKSIFCYTPTVCEGVFEALRKPIDNNLIFNIPFTVPTKSAEQPAGADDAATTSTATGATNTPNTTPRKTRADTPRKRSQSKGVQQQKTGSPYRTLSHFGFNSPQREPQPQHKHIPFAMEPKKYVPLRKSVSYEEIFSSPRYIDLCENCFEKVVRLKPELIQMKTRLRNLYDYSMCPTAGANATAQMAAAAAGGCGAGEYFIYPTAIDLVGGYEYVECTSSETTETLPPFSSQLEPLIEVEEGEGSSVSGGGGGEAVGSATVTVELDPLKQHDDQHNHSAGSNVEKTISHSSFIEKIMRMNYSEESTNINFLQTPRSVCSDITIELERTADVSELNPVCSFNKHKVMLQKQEEEEEEEQQHQQEEEKQQECNEFSNTPCNLANAVKVIIQNADGDVEYVENSQGEIIEEHASVTEIWDFGNWQAPAAAVAATADQENHSPILATLTDVETNSTSFYYTGRAATAAAIDNNEYIIVDAIDNTKKSLSSTDEKHQVQASRELMSRDERSRRKLVFQELWEDHVAFFDGKEQNALSDTESAIDETVEKQQQQQQVVGDEEQEEDQQPQQELQQMLDEKYDHENAHVSGVIEQKLQQQKEVFLGRSLIVKKKLVYPQQNENADTTDDNPQPQELIIITRAELDDKIDINDNDKEEKSDDESSSHTYNVPSRENLFFRTAPHQSVDAFNDCSMLRICDETIEMASAFGGRNLIEKQPHQQQQVTTDLDDPPVFPYNATIQEFELYKQNVNSINQQQQQQELEENTCDIIEFEREFLHSTTDIGNNFTELDENESQFADLVEAAEKEDLTNLSDEFEEILIRVQSLQVADDDLNRKKVLEVNLNVNNNEQLEFEEKQIDSDENDILKALDIIPEEDAIEIRTQVEEAITQGTEPKEEFEAIMQESQDVMLDTEEMMQKFEEIVQIFEEINEYEVLDVIPEEKSEDSKEEAAIEKLAFNENSMTTLQSEDVDVKTEEKYKSSEQIMQEFQKNIQESKGIMQESEKIMEEFEEMIRKSEEIIQKSEEMIQESGEMIQEPEEIFQKSEEMTQESEEMIQVSEEMTQESEEVTQESEEVIQKSEETIQESEEMIQESEEMTQESGEMIQEPEEMTQESEEMIQQSGEMIQEFEEMIQESEEMTQESEEMIQESEEMTQESEEMTQESEEMIQVSEEITQESAELFQESESIQKSEETAHKSEKVIQDSEEIMQKSEEMIHESEKSENEVVIPDVVNEYQETEEIVPGIITEHAYCEELLVELENEEALKNIIQEELITGSENIDKVEIISTPHENSEEPSEDIEVAIEDNGEMQTESEKEMHIAEIVYDEIISALQEIAKEDEVILEKDEDFMHEAEKTFQALEDIILSDENMIQESQEETQRILVEETIQEIVGVDPDMIEESIQNSSVLIHEVERTVQESDKLIQKAKETVQGEAVGEDINKKSDKNMQRESLESTQCALESIQVPVRSFEVVEKIIINPSESHEVLGTAKSTWEVEGSIQDSVEYIYEAKATTHNAEDPEEEAEGFMQDAEDSINIEYLTQDAEESLQVTEESIQSSDETEELLQNAEETAPNSECADDDEENKEFDEVERKILRKIKLNQLSESEVIFDKIETTIRNKLTPSKIERLLKNQKQKTDVRPLNITSTNIASSSHISQSNSLHKQFIASTPAKDETTTATVITVDNSFTSLNLSRIFGEWHMNTNKNAKEEGEQQNQQQEHDSSILTLKNFNSSERERSFDSQQQQQEQENHRYFRRSRSLTPFRDQYRDTTPPAHLNNTTTPPQVPRKSINAMSSMFNISNKKCKLPAAIRSAPDFRHQKSGGSDGTAAAGGGTPNNSNKRNFILENIRNAAIPRNNVKRLQGNAQAIFCKNPFGPVTKLLNSPSPTSTTSRNLSAASCSSAKNKKAQKQAASADKSTVATSADTSIYSFQSKLVRGSPRFWVSISKQTPAKKLQTNKNLQKRRKKQQRETSSAAASTSIDSTCSLVDDDDGAVALVAPINCSAVGPVVALVQGDAMLRSTSSSATFTISPTATTTTKVDVEIEALGAQIQQFHPRLESYKRKLNDYGEHVAKCSRDMDECMTAQAEITQEHNELRENILLNQYAERISCQVQTYSLSETED